MLTAVQRPCQAWLQRWPVLGLPPHGCLSPGQMGTQPLRAGLFSGCSSGIPSQDTQWCPAQALILHTCFYSFSPFMTKDFSVLSKNKPLCMWLLSSSVGRALLWRAGGFSDLSMWKIRSRSTAASYMSWIVHGNNSVQWCPLGYMRLMSRPCYFFSFLFQIQEWPRDASGTAVESGRDSGAWCIILILKMFYQFQSWKYTCF